MTVRRALFVVFTAAILIFTAVSCDQELLPTAVDSITLDKSEIDLFIGDTAELVATVLPEDASDKTVTWTSSSEGVVTVKEGVITATGEGTATVTAKAGDKEATCKVKVSKVFVQVSTITLDRTELALTKGETATLTATVMPEDASDKTVTWVSSNEEVATVKDGIVKAVGDGTVTITATAGAKSATCDVTVTVPVSGISLDMTTIGLYVDETVTLTATVSPEDATDPTVTWTSNNEQVAKVEDGVVTAVSEGKATITAKAGDKIARCRVTVSIVPIPATEIVLDKPEIDIVRGETATLVATVTPADTTDKISWESDKPGIASVEGGVVTAVAKGSATITVRAGEQSATCKVTVIVPVTSVSLDQAELAMDKGKTMTLTATVLPEDATDKTVTWSSSNEKVAVVKDGSVTAVADGEAIITAEAGGKEASCKVTVTTPVTSVTLDKTELAINKGEKKTLTATVLPGDATDPTVTWSSGNEKVATVKDGVVTAVADGEAIITAKAGEKEAKCKITVTTPVTSIALDKTELPVIKGNTATLTSKVLPEDATDPTVTWSSSDEKVATVSDGVITAIADGEATITAKAGEKEAKCKITVTTPVTSVSLDNKELYIIKGKTATLKATVLPEDATDPKITWSSSNEKVATVKDGTVTAVGDGEATITAKAGEKEATCKVTVNTPVTSIALDKTELPIIKGNTATLTATVLPEDATDPTVTWSSSDEKVATVKDGVVTAVGDGEATITAKAGEKEAKSKITVTTPVTSITLDTTKTELTIVKGTKLILTATVLPEDATDPKITWSSSNEKVATVKDGMITAIADGETTITAKAGEKEARCKVTVGTPVTSITLDKTELPIIKGNTATLTVTVLPEDATDPTVTWSSSDEKIATVNGGVITAIADGEATITAKAGEKEATCKVTVSTPVTSIALDKTELPIIKGNTATLTATVLPEDATDPTVTWSSSDEKVATVKDGVVTAVGDGEATITAKAGEKEASCKILVTTPVTSVTLDNKELSITKGMTATLKATVLPEDATDPTVTWSSSDEEIATVKDGTVTAVAVGKATITAKAGGYSATCEVSVIIPATGISLDQSTLSMYVEDTVTLTATVTPEGVTDKTQWSSSNTEVVTVEDGKVTATGAGTATITATSGEFSATCDVSVKGIYKITFDANDGSGNKAYQVIKIDEGSVALTRGSFEGVDNAQFVGWNSKADYSGEIYTDTQTVTITSNMTLYAQWVPADTFEIVGGELQQVWGSFNNDSIPANFAVPRYINGSEVTSIGDGVFNWCPNLKEVVIPDSVTSIGEGAFGYCFNLEVVVIPDTVSSIGDYAFDSCSMLKEVEIPESMTSIGKFVFGDSGLEEITIPDSVTTIGEKAFYRTNLKKISISSSVTSIGSEAFGYCGQLSDVTFADGSRLTSIGGGAFNRCSRLESISIPASVTTIGSGAFERCTNLKSVTFSDGCKIDTIASSTFECCSSLESIMIPETVTVIDNGAFRESGLTGITIPASVTRIGDSAFISCNNLGTLVFADGSKLETIGEYAFEYGLNISSITIPSSVTSIGKEAFKYCYPVTFVNDSEVKLYYSFTNNDYVYRLGSPSEIAISPLYTGIGSGAFKDCTNLISVTIPASVRYIGTDAFKGCYPEVFVNNSDVELDYEFTDADYVALGSPSELVISPLYTSIAAEAFKGNTTLTRITIPASVTSIGKDAFRGCNPTTITNNSGVELNYEFTNADYVLLGSPAELVISPLYTSIGRMAFWTCEGLTGITIPDTVTSIGDDAFYKCTGLKSIIIPDSVTTISDLAFSYSGLESITIPDTVTSLGDCLFQGCSNLSNVTLPKGLKSISQGLFQYCTGLKNIEIPNTVTAIERYAFEGCSSLKSIEIPSTVTEIGDAAFATSGIESITIPEGVTTISMAICKGCAALKEVSFPSSVTGIELEAFHGCTSLESVTIPSGVTTIGRRAFMDCSSLDSVTIPASVTSIGENAFLYCFPSVFENSGTHLFYPFGNGEWAKLQSLSQEPVTELTISPLYTSISKEAFRNDSNLTSVTIPASVTNIGSKAFYGCSKLDSVTIIGTSVSVYSDAFKYCYPSTFVYNDPNWNYTFTKDDYQTGLMSPSVLVISPMYTNIVTEAFMNNTKLTSVTIPSSVKSIGTDAFKGCNPEVFVNNSGVKLEYEFTNADYVALGCPKDLVISPLYTSIADKAFFAGENKPCYPLESITIPDTVTSIGAYAFCGCENLGNITLPDDVTRIEDATFYGCSSLKSFTIPAAVTYIGSNSLSECDGITSIMIPKSVTIIGAFAFAGCSNLASVTFEQGSTLDEIDNGLFKGCTMLSSISVPSTVKTIGYYAFEDCTSLASFTIPGNVTVIERKAFNGCENLTSIIIPESVTEIGTDAFKGCSRAEEIIIPASVTSIGGTETFKWCYPSVFEDKSGEVLYYAFGKEDYERLQSLSESPITQLTISSLYSQIADGAFKDNTSITSITIPDSVAYIRSEAFSGCINLTSVTIGDNSSLCSIGDKAFYGCRNLDSITIPANVPSCGIGTDAFKGCNPSDFVDKSTHVSFDFDTDDYQLLGSPEELSISPMYASIGNGAFKGNTTLTSITIPASVYSIGSEAFYGCSNLDSVTILGTNVIVYDDSFRYCYPSTFVCNDPNWNRTFTADDYQTGLKSPTELVISPLYTSIAAETFKGNTALTSITIPSSVTSIGIDAFKGCYPEVFKNNSQVTTAELGYVFGQENFHELETLAGKAITELSISPLYSSIDVIAFYGKTTLTKVTIPSSVTSIGDGAFYYCTGLESITIPSSVTTIRGYTFSDCTSLESITIPSGVTSIEEGAFNNCSGLESITIPSSVTSIGEDAFSGCCPSEFINNSGVTVEFEFTSDSYQKLGSPANLTVPAIYTSIRNNALSCCDNLESVTFEEGSKLTAIGNYAFGNCSNLVSITIPDSVTSIGEEAFYYCDNLKSITIPDSVISIGEKAFYYCTKLESVTFEDESKLATIGKEAFRNCIGLKSITLPSSLTSLGEKAFYSCEKLGSITIPSGVTSISDYAFSGCTGLGSITLPSSVTSIGQYAFYSCENLESITLPSSVTSIGQYAFYYCTKLESITIPSSVTSIGVQAFYRCTNLESITIPSSVTSIGEQAFSYCTSLENITIPSGVTSIGMCTFQGCTSLTSIIIPSSVTSIGNYAFSGCSGLTSITIPDSIASIGKSAFEDCSKIESITIPAAVDSLGEWTFANCSKLAAVTFKEDSQLAEIGYFAFGNCSSLESVSIPSCVISIGSNAFMGCSSLQSVTFGDDSSLTEIGGEAFNGCSSLQTITIPDGVTIIDYRSFKDCTSLISVTLPVSVTNLGEGLFRNCDDLATLTYLGTETQWNSVTKGSSWNFNAGYSQSFQIIYNPPLS